MLNPNCYNHSFGGQFAAGEGKGNRRRRGRGGQLLADAWGCLQCQNNDDDDDATACLSFFLWCSRSVAGSHHHKGGPDNQLTLATTTELNWTDRTVHHPYTWQTTNRTDRQGMSPKPVCNFHGSLIWMNGRRWTESDVCRPVTWLEMPKQTHRWRPPFVSFAERLQDHRSRRRRRLASQISICRPTSFQFSNNDDASIDWLDHDRHFCDCSKTNHSSSFCQHPMTAVLFLMLAWLVVITELGLGGLAPWLWIAIANDQRVSHCQSRRQQRTVQTGILLHDLCEMGANDDKEQPHWDLGIRFVVIGLVRFNEPGEPPSNKKVLKECPVFAPYLDDVLVSFQAQ